MGSDESARIAVVEAPNLGTNAASRPQKLIAAAFCFVFGLVALLTLPRAAAALQPMPGFIASHQTALILIYALTARIFFGQFRRTGSIPVLSFAAGAFYSAAIVLAQLLSFPNIFSEDPILGQGTDTTIWLWVFWHIGPPLFALAPAWFAGDGLKPAVKTRDARRIARIAVALTILAVAFITYVLSEHVALLPKLANGDDYRRLTTTGTGPAIATLIGCVLLLLCIRTQLRTVFQLWLAVSLALLLLDTVITVAGSARGTIGWLTGRLEALAAALVILAVYARELERVLNRVRNMASDAQQRGVELQQARDNLATALQAAEMAEWRMDLRSGAIERSEQHDRIYGYDKLLPEFTRESFFKHVLPADMPQVESALAKARTTGLLELRCRIKRATDKSVRWIVLRGRAYPDEDGRTRKMSGVIMDVTDRHEIEERLNQAQKMEAIGQLTGGVAHDFNNLLTAIVGNLDMISRAPGDASRVERLARTALQAASRGGELTQKLLAFARKEVAQPETVNPNHLLTDFRDLLQRALGETIELETQLDATLDPVRLDPGQFQSAILNLCGNARDAMPEGGKLKISTRNMRIHEESTLYPDARPGAYVVVSIADTGAGMEEGTLARAFEPFFTTKGVGSGTGLGLSQVYGFCRQTGGFARITSNVGRGTTVEMYLPRSHDRPERAASGLILPLRRAAEGEVILVVEDDPAVLEMAVESLTDLGYQTLTAEDAQSALSILRSNARIDILFSDVVMPGGMNGVQLSVEAKRLRAELKVLLSSGYTGAALGSAGLPDDMPILTKPYRREDLAKKLRMVLRRE
jgi:signal transduction histidine kinase/CheY-like chemotaxis protein